MLKGCFLLKRTDPVDITAGESVTNGEALRIFNRDADRTLTTTEGKKRVVDLMKLCWTEVKDYHQGGGFICAFLGVFLSSEDVARIYWHLHRTTMSGYFSGQAETLVADCVVFYKLLQVMRPNIVEKMGKMGMVAENAHMWLSKWLVGAGIHSAPFSVLFAYFELLLQSGTEFLFKFAMAWVLHWESTIMTCNAIDDLNCLLSTFRFCQERGRRRKRWIAAWFLR